ncbi:hypothetical protein ACFY2R_17295 [Micromonospora olivasterospora]|uniref:SurA-like protein n=1 Tax=Micromonospora olivasterospora TaxID=1880 RepID=A0A562IBX9_MICOL|nr:hypothetical protein [Micromonospora olivasterospora]TWH68412.1 hypothetical protein JD77_03404 [Micromonospora olivasterospora]
MRARRLLAATVAAFGVLSLGACGKSAPSVAAYVGDTTYSVARVDDIYDDVQAKFGAAVRAQAAQTGATPPPEQQRSAVTRQDVVNLLVSLELGRRAVAARGVSVPDQVTPEQLAPELRVPADAEYAKLWAEWIDISQALGATLPPAELSDDAVMAVYHAIEKTGQIQAGLPVVKVRQMFGEGGFVRAATALSSALREEARQAGASINPRYRPIGVPSVVSTGQALVFYHLPYIDQDGPVTDISTPQAPAASAAAGA